jgi:hypothetical protein
MLFQVNNIAVMVHQKIGHGTDNSLPVGAED